MEEVRQEPTGKRGRRSRVIVLDEDTANRIAAGEVVQRPASVVKELVENSIDAGSDRVIVRVWEGGQKRIEVTDNGHGMGPDDAVLAFERHATSKIRSAEDLEAVMTLGFRGEALPSIAAVSRVEVTTRTPFAPEGVRVRVAGGSRPQSEPVGCPVGTRVVVQDLFYNTPARRKHLKSQGVELRRIGHVLSVLALAYPGIVFGLSHNGRKRFQTPGSGRLLDAIGALYGVKTAKGMLPLDYSEAGVSVRGYVGRPTVSRGTRDQQTFIVNGRGIQNPSLRGAVESAYVTLLPSGRYPVVVVVLELDPRRVDVNVHPAKEEVRLAGEREVYRVLRRAVVQALQQAVLIPGAESTPFLSAPVFTSSGSGGSGPFSKVSSSSSSSGGPEGQHAGYNLGVKSQQQDFWREVPRRTYAEEVETRRAGFLAQVRIIGQLHARYILAEGEEGLFLVDQHAAHERVYYDRLLGEEGKDFVGPQNLLVPFTLELNPGELDLVMENTEVLAKAGFELLPFGGNTILVRAVPTIFGAGANEETLRGFLDRLKEFYDTESGRLEKEEAYLAMAACKAAVKARESLSIEEMEALLRDLSRTEQPYTCPHGRPTVSLVSRQEIDKRFGRG